MRRKRIRRIFQVLCYKGNFQMNAVHKYFHQSMHSLRYSYRFKRITTIKYIALNDTMESGSTMELSDLQSWNAQSPIEVTEPVMVIVSISKDFVYFCNAFSDGVEITRYWTAISISFECIHHNRGDVFCGQRRICMTFTHNRNLIFG